jgi:hypothetical protein
MHTWQSTFQYFLSPSILIIGLTGSGKRDSFC